jgi:O-antigen ligase
MAFVALLAYLFFLFIRPQEFLQPVFGFPLVKISLIIAALAMIAQKERRFDAPQNIFLLLLMPVILLSGALNGWVMGGVESVSAFITSIFLPFLVIQNTISTVKKQQIVMLCLIFFVLVMVHNGMDQKASETGVGWSGALLSQKTRITYLGIFNDPNDLGMLFVMVVPFVFYFLNRVSLFIKPLFIACAVMLLNGIYLTNSRGALLGTMSLLVLWFYLKYGFKKSFFAAILAIPMAAVLMGQFRTIDAEEASAEGRLDAWYEGFQMLFHHPLFGVGMGQFTEHHHLTSHNSFVLVFSELGLVGYFLWIAFLTVCGFMILMLWKTGFKLSLVTKDNVEEAQIARKLIYSMLGFFITSFFLSRAFTPLLYFFCAMIVSGYYRANSGLVPQVTCRYKDFSLYVWLISLSSIILIYSTVRLFS